jgi:hypothetical protein
MFLASLACAAVLAASTYYELARLTQDGAREQQGLMLMLLRFIPA